MIEIFNQLNQKTVNLYGLILSAMGIRYILKKDGRRWSLWIYPEDRNMALDAIHTYLQENDNSFYLQEQIEFTNFRSYPIWGLCILLACFHLLRCFVWDSHLFLERYAFDAAAVLNGDLYRCLTALFIHQNMTHLLSNCLCLLIFGPAVCSVVGWAVGPIIIVLSGAFGNGMNALFYEAYHRSIGSSTAVFGAVGFISVHQMLQKLKNGQKKSRLWIYPASGLALLAIIGSSAQTDVLAHLFGFVSGIICGVAYFELIHHQLGTKGQISVFFVFFIIFLLSWMKPLVYPSTNVFSR